MRRYYALFLTRTGTVRLVKAMDGDDTLLDEAQCAWQAGSSYRLWIKATGHILEAGIDDKPMLRATDEDAPLESGGVAFVCREGCVWSSAMRVRPID